VNRCLRYAAQRTPVTSATRAADAVVLMLLLLLLLMQLMTNIRRHVVCELLISYAYANWAFDIRLSARFIFIIIFYRATLC